MTEFIALILDLGMGLLGLVVGGIFIYALLIFPIYRLKSPKLSKDEQIHRLQNEVSKLQDQISKLESDNEDLVREKQNLIFQKELLEDKLKTGKSDYLSLNDKYNLALSELSTRKNEIKNAKSQNEELIHTKNDDLETLSNSITSLSDKQSEAQKLIDNLQKEKNNILKKYNELYASHSGITKSFEKNIHWFHGITPEFKMLYKKMDAKRLFRSFDPTLSFISTEFEIGHTDKPNNKTYRTTLISCTCDDFSKNLKASAPCKHMIFLAYNLGNMFYYKEEAKKYLKTDVAFLAEKENVEKELRNKRKKLKDIKNKLKELETDLSHPIKIVKSEE